MTYRSWVSASLDIMVHYPDYMTCPKVVSTLAGFTDKAGSSAREFRRQASLSLRFSKAVSDTLRA